MTCDILCESVEYYERFSMRALAASSHMGIIDEGRMSRRTIADVIEIFDLARDFLQICE